MGRSRKRQNSGVAQGARRLVLLVVIPLIIAAVAAVILLSGKLPGIFQSASGKTTEELVESVSEASVSEESFEPDNNQYNQYFAGSILERDAIPEINQLMEAYFQAEMDCDVDRLNSLFTSGDTSMAEQQKRDLEFLKQYVEGYGNISCYTVQGPTDDFYIVYTYYETKYHLADTWAPGLIHPYVQRLEDGSFKIYDEVMSQEMTDFMDQVEVNEDVRLLAAEVDNQLAEALAADSQLSSMVEFVRKGPDYEEEGT